MWIQMITYHIRQKELIILETILNLSNFQAKYILLSFDPEVTDVSFD